MNPLQNLLGAMLGGNAMTMPPMYSRFLRSIRDEAQGLSRQIDAKSAHMDGLREALERIHRAQHEPLVNSAGFANQPAYRFFRSAGQVVDAKLDHVLGETGKLQSSLESIVNVISEPRARRRQRDDESRYRRGFGQERAHIFEEEDDELQPDQVMTALEAFKTAIGHGFEVYGHNAHALEKFSMELYHSAVNHYRYLQRRFLNVQRENNVMFKAPWEKGERQEHEAYDFSRVKFLRMPLVRDNAVLTDLLVTISDQLPQNMVRLQRERGKRKEKPVKYLDPFELDHSARTLVELCDPTYFEYALRPQEFVQRVSGALRDYHGVMRDLEEPIRGLFGLLDRAKSFMLTDIDMKKDLDRPFFDPTQVAGMLENLDYSNIRPDPEEIRPRGKSERELAKARTKLLEHLLAGMEAVYAAPEHEKFGIARETVEKGVKLRDDMRKIETTPRTRKLDTDKRKDNYFYIVKNGELGAVSFEREPAPNVKMKEVYGKSFDMVKGHIEELARYGNFAHLIQATAPRGKIKSGMVLIGPYGCGKTELARAIGGDPRFIAADVAVQDLLTAWFGEFEKNVDRIWDGAKELQQEIGRNLPFVLLMDEFDSFFSNSNGHWVDNTYKRVQKAIQMKLDGVKDYSGIIPVAFTNEPHSIPMAIYRRFKYVTPVGQLDEAERGELFQRFLTNGLPLSHGFRQKHYADWAKRLDGATGDVIGKVADMLHEQYMHQFLDEHPAEARRLDNYLQRKRRNEEEPERGYVRREMGRRMLVTPTMVEASLVKTVEDPVIKAQIATAKGVYAAANSILEDLSKSAKQHDAAFGGKRYDYQLGFAHEAKKK